MDHYLLDNTASETVERLNTLEICYDGATREFLMRTGVAPGWHCLEVGAGGGSIGLWLSDMVGGRGQVTVTDVTTDRLDPALQARDNITVLRHDIANDALPDVEFDLIHARLVLLHLPDRREVLRKLVRSLRPGGWLVLEEFDCGWTPIVATPDQHASRLFTDVHTRFLEVLTQAGADVRWGRKVYGEFLEAGLSDVSSSTSGMAWPGRSTGARLHRANTAQLADRIVGDGITREDLRLFWALLDNPAFAVQSYLLISVRGRLGS